MHGDLLEKAAEEAKLAVEHVKDYKAETYLAVLLCRLLREVGGVADKQVVLANSSAGSKELGQERTYMPPEFFAGKSWTNESDKIVLAGYFLERYSAEKRYNINDLRGCLVRAKVTLPKNVPQAVLKSVRRGWMMEVPEGKGGVKAYVLTQTGVRRVQDEMEK